MKTIHQYEVSYTSKLHKFLMAAAALNEKYYTDFKYFVSDGSGKMTVHIVPVKEYKDIYYLSVTIDDITVAGPTVVGRQELDKCDLLVVLSPMIKYLLLNPYEFMYSVNTGRHKVQFTQQVAFLDGGGIARYKRTLDNTNP